MIITFNDLFNNPLCKPRVHGNGFLQLDLPVPNYRLHIWPEDKLQTQKVYTGIHNHRFSFSSTVLLGTLVHTQFRDLFVDDIGGNYNIYRTVPRDREDKGLELIDNNLYTLTQKQVFFLKPESCYNFEYGNFHDSRGFGLTATLMHKVYVDPETEPIVLCPAGKVPDLDFNRYQFKDEELWPIVKQVFDKIKEIYV